MIDAPHTSIWLGLFSVLLFGLRHGIDHDHIAAITDITSTEPQRTRAMRNGLYYALGHAVVILLLGSVAVLLRAQLPAGIDIVMERFVGVTLVLLGLYVSLSLVRSIRSGTELKLRSRWTLLFDLLHRGGAKLGLRKPSPRSNRTRSAFVIGMIHGVGAETPSQLALFLFAAGVGGSITAMMGVLVFVIGLLITNTIMCAVAVGLFQTGKKHPHFYQGIAGLTAAYSLIVGVMFLIGGADLLPPL